MIWLIPIENRKTRVDPLLLDALCPALQEAFHQECEIQNTMKPPVYGRAAGSSRYIGARLLESLPIQDDILVLGITAFNLSMIGFDYTTGLSDPPNRRAIVSTFQLRSPQDNLSTGAQQFTERVVKRAIHELGHVTGLSHCEVPTCVMNYSDTVEDIDRKSFSFCEACRIDLDERLKTLSNQPGG